RRRPCEVALSCGLLLGRGGGEDAGGVAAGEIEEEIVEGGRAGRGQAAAEECLEAVVGVEQRQVVAVALLLGAQDAAIGGRGAGLEAAPEPLAHAPLQLVHADVDDEAPL